MVDAEIAGDACADGELALDVAADWHGQIVRKQHVSDLAIPLGGARTAKQGAVLLAAAELLRRHEAAFPQSLAILPGARLVHLESPRRGGLDIQRKTVADHRLAQAGGLA